MAHAKLKSTGKTLFGKPISKPAKGFGPFTRKEGSRPRETRRQLEVLERRELVKRAAAKGKRVRGKVRLSNNPFK